MSRCIFFVAVSVILLAGSVTTAEPLKGFHEGPYIAFEAGALQAEFDTDQQSGARVGRDIEPVFGLLFGWNITDIIATELKGFYSQSNKSGNREHIIGSNINGKFTWINDRLTHRPSLQILPYLVGGLALRFGVLPGNDNASDQSVVAFGYGPSIGGGISLLWKKYIMFGVGAQGDFLFFDESRQNLDLATPTANNQLIYNGGFEPSFLTAFTFGIHY